MSYAGRLLPEAPSRQRGAMMDAERLARIEHAMSWTAPEAVQARDELLAEVRRLQGELDRVTAERDEYRADAYRVAAERDTWNRKAVRLGERLRSAELENVRYRDALEAIASDGWANGETPPYVKGYARRILDGKEDDPCGHDSVDTFASGAGRRVDVCMVCDLALRFWNVESGTSDPWEG